MKNEKWTLGENEPKRTQFVVLASAKPGLSSVFCLPSSVFCLLSPALPLRFDVRTNRAFGDRFGAGLENGFGNYNIGFVSDFDVRRIGFNN